MDTDLRLIDRFRTRLYALPIPVFAAVVFLVLAIEMLVVITVYNELDPRLDLSAGAIVAISVIVGAIIAASWTKSEKSSRKNFFDACDRAAYHRAIELETLPDVGAPTHWCEHMLTEIAERSRTYIGTVALATAMLLTLFSMVAAGGGWAPGVVALAVCAVLAAVSYVQFQRSTKVKKLYETCSSRTEGVTR